MMSIGVPLVSVCPTCGETIPPAAPMGQCPGCLWRVSFDGIEDHDDSTEPWVLLGDNELFEEIARGGMGVVYRARQRGLDREVALKVLRGGEFADDEARRRFHVEAAAAARLQHPGIVAIHDIGEDDGVPWFSMDLLTGGNLVRRVGEMPLPAKEAARCVRQVADAVQYAHEQGVLHRDLKPSNILLGSDGLPRVTDFGIARRIAVDTTDPLTRTGQGLGSPGYAAPELALGGTADVRTDVYGLGALLYYLLTGRPPFQGPTLDAILLQLRESDPVPPRRLNPTVPRDLETICLHALSREPGRRYATASGFAEELDRFLAGEPIRARPLSPVEQTVRWGYRHPGLAAMSGLVLLLLAGLVASGFLYGARQARLEHRAALLAEAREQRAAAADVSRKRALAALRAAWEIKPSAEIRNEAIACLSMPEIVIGGVVPMRPPPPRDRSRERFTAGFAGNEAFVSDTRTGERLQTLVHPRKVYCVDWRDDLLVSMCEDRFIYIWDAAKGSLLHRLSGHEGLPAAAVFRKGGQEFVSLAQDGHVRLWHAARGEEEVQFDGAEPHPGPAWWEANDSKLFAPRLDGTGLDFFHVTWPRSIKILAPPGEELHTENTRSLSLSPDGTLAATVDEQAVRVWDLDGARLLTTVKKSQTEWMSVRFSPDGSALWICGFDAQLLRLPIHRERGNVPPVGPPEKVAPLTGALLADIRPDGKQLALSHNHDGQWLLFSPGQPTVTLPADHLMAATFSPDGRRLATTSYSHPGIRIWSLPTGNLERELQTETPVLSVRFTSDGKALWLLTEREVQRLDTDNWKPLFSASATGLRGLTFSPDGKLAACHERGAVRLLRAEDLVELARLAVPHSAGWLGNASLDFSEDASVLAAHTALGSLIVWNIPELRAELRQLGMDWSY